MDKYGVVVDEHHIKVANEGARPCPQCGSRSVDFTSLTPHCPSCGTEPWEKHAQKEEGTKDRRRK